MTAHKIVSPSDWLEARKRFLAEEKAFTQARDRLSAARRDLPWVRAEKNYVFETPTGKKSLADLFDGRSQLIAQHFMFAPDWNDGCKSCSFWADGYNGFVVHLHQRDTSFVAVSRAPLAKLQGYAKRLGWDFPWVSSGDGDFSYDFNVSFHQDGIGPRDVTYNYATVKSGMTDLPGISVFYRDTDGLIYHTYSAYARGLDMMNAAYHYLDLTPKGRDEDKLPYPMDWVRIHDRYERP
ncbi:MAG TPA: thioredoxin family protein [Stellaceae bacterium]|nr:thioredoxin family protein [Stellaceae bacterium]